MEKEEEIIQNISGKICSVCGGKAPGWKCPKCGETSKIFDPLHRQKCPDSAKMQAQCEKCGEVEQNCTCLSR